LQVKYNAITTTPKFSTIPIPIFARRIEADILFLYRFFLTRQKKIAAKSLATFSVACHQTFKKNKSHKFCAI
jgi:hypothetical protein